MAKKHLIDAAGTEPQPSSVVRLKWSEVLESAFDYYYTEYIPAWTLCHSQFSNVGDKLFISKSTKDWVSWEKINQSERPDVATLFDLLPDLPEDQKYWHMIKELGSEGIKNPEDHFWENMFSYEKTYEVNVNGRAYHIEWEA